MLPNREGLFNAYPVDIGIDETGPNNLATCIIRFKLYEELQPSGEWADCLTDNFDITGYFYLEKRDGSLNTVTIDALKNALGWDGRDPFRLQEVDLSQRAVQVKLAFEEYGGKTRLKVQYLNPFGSTGGGGVTKADDATRKSITNRLGPKFRATAGPAQAPATPAKPGATPKLPPAKPKAQPATPPPPAPKPEPAPAQPETPADPQAVTMEEAWAEFCAAYEKLGPNGSPEDRQQQWFAILAKLFPGRQPRELSPQEWAAMRDQGPGEIIPF
jgi:hypothetical protein